MRCVVRWREQCPESTVDESVAKWVAMSVIVIFLVVGIVLVVGAAVITVLTLFRSRVARSEWLGELDDIRRTSLGDTDEVTGAMQAVGPKEDLSDQSDGPADASAHGHFDAAKWPTEPEPGDSATSQEPVASEVAEVVVAENVEAAPVVEAPVEPGTQPGASRLDVVTDRPDRHFAEGHTKFSEFDRANGAVVRIDMSEPEGIRVVNGVDATGAATCAVDLPHGLLWHRSRSTPHEMCSVRTPAGWINVTGATVLVQVEEAGWSYAMCLEGDASLETMPDGAYVPFPPGHIGRGKAGQGGFEITKVGHEALESEGAVRRQRRFDDRTP